MKVVYIAHQISGDIEINLSAIRKIVRQINLEQADVIPFVPYYVDVVSMDDRIPAERARGIANDHELLRRKGVIDAVWLYGPTISKGMKSEIEIADAYAIPVIAMSPETKLELINLRGV